MRRMVHLFLAVLVLVIPALSFAATLTRTLAVGSEGEDVKVLQQVLIDLGYFDQRPTGYFGGITEKAVLEYQETNKLEVAGIVGPKTRALINAYLNWKAKAPPVPGAKTVSVQESFSPASSLTRTLTVGSQGEDVKVLQKILINLGYFKQEATGYFGGITEAAVKAYQGTNGLEAVGIVGSKTRALINAYIIWQEKLGDDAGAGTSSPESVPTPILPFFPTTTTEEVTATPDEDIPVINVINPSPSLGATTKDVDFTVATEKSALCRFSTTSGVGFTQKKSFENTGGTFHSIELANLWDGSTYAYYVQCQDMESLKLSDDFYVSFQVNLPTTMRMPGAFQVAAAAAQSASIGPWSLGNLLAMVFGL